MVKNKSFPNRLHATAASLGLLNFGKNFTSLQSFFETIKAAITGIKQLKLHQHA